MKKLFIIAAAVLLSAGAAFAQAENASAPAAQDGMLDASSNNNLRDFFNPNGQYPNLVRFYAAGAARMKGDNAKAGTGGEVGVSAAFDENDPTLGLFVGYYKFDDRFTDGRSYKIVPVELRVGYDVPINEKTARFCMAVSGGYSINNYDGHDTMQDIDNSYILEGQVGLKFMIYKRFAASLWGGYQYLNPQITTLLPGGSSQSYLDLSGPFVKFGLEF